MRTYLSIAENTIFQILSRAATAVVGLIVTRLITSNFGLELYGQYQIVLAYVTLWWILTDFGLNAVVVREIAQDEARIQGLFSSLLSLRALLGAGLLAVSLLLLVFLPYSGLIKLGVLIASVTIFGQALTGTTHAIFQVKQHYDRQFWANLIGSLLFLSLVFIIAAKWRGNVLALVTAFTSGYLLITAASLLFAQSWVKLKFSLDTQELNRIFKITLPFGLALLLSLGTFKIDAILMSVLQLQSWTNAAAVGIYQLAYKIFELVLVVPVFFMNVMYPILVRHLEKSANLFSRTLAKTFLSLIAVGLAATIFIYWTAPWIIGLLAEGSDFTPAIGVLRIFSLEFLLFYLSAPFMWAVLVLKKQRALIWVYGTAFVFNLLTNLWAIPRFAFIGAAVTTGLTESLTLSLLIWVVWRSWPAKALS